MFRKIRRKCWNKYVDELKQKLNERILSPVSSLKKKTLISWQTRFIQ